MNLPLLFRLQDLHRETDMIDKRLKELNEARDMAKLKEEYRRLRESYANLEEKLKKNNCRQEMRNNEIKNLEYNRKTCEVIKFSRETDTVKKLETIEKQLEKVEEKRKEAEEDIIALINEADNVGRELAETKRRLVFIKKKYLSRKENDAKAVEELKKRKTELESEIQCIMKEADKESLEMYLRLQKVHSDPVALVENRKCSGCKMEVPAIDYEALKSGNNRMRCQSCGRLLYFLKT